MSTLRTIEVIPNPFIALDHEGVPQGVVSAGVPGVYVGAHLDLVASRKTGKSRFYYPTNKDGSIVRKVLFTAEIVACVQAGELLAANKPDALICGISDKEYLPPEEALAKEIEKAQAYWTSARGPDAKIGEIPRTATEENPEAPLPPAKASVEVTPNVTMTMTEKEV